MDSDFRVIGKNSAAPFSLTVHRGEGMMLLAMNWRSGMPPMNFAGFAIQYREPGGHRIKTMHNRIGFPGQDPGQDGIRTTEAPIQKFRWVFLPSLSAQEGTFWIMVKPMFMGAAGSLTASESQEVELDLMRQTIPGKLNISFTRGFVSSQAFVTKFSDGGGVAALLPEKDDDSLEFKPTHPRSDEAYKWMGFEARATTLDLLKRAIESPDACVRAIAFDFNVPKIVDHFAALGPRLKIIIDNSSKHKAADKDESRAAERLAAAGVQSITRQKMGALQHHKSIGVLGGGIDQVVFGSTNLSWRGPLCPIEQQPSGE